MAGRPSEHGGSEDGRVDLNPSVLISSCASDSLVNACGVGEEIHEDVVVFKNRFGPFGHKHFRACLSSLKFHIAAMKTNRALAASISILVTSSLAVAQASNGSILYDTTWAGPVQIANTALTPNSTSGFNLAEGTLIMPHLSIPQKPHEQVDHFSASYWVGLDGAVPSGDSGAVRGLWQAGVIMTLSPATANSSETSIYTAFYEWVPNDPISLTADQLALAEDDHLYVRLNTSAGGLVASATFINLNTSKEFGVTMEAPVAWRGPTWPAPGTSAEWIVEAGTYLNGTRYVWPDFGNASFLDARACYNTTGECVVAGQARTNGQITAVFWNDTKTVYSSTAINCGDVKIAYVEEDFTA